MRRRLMIRLSLLALLAALGSAGIAAADNPLRGTWRPDTYILKDGSRHPIAGIVTFSDREWTFLVFVMDNGEPRRAEGEGGTFTLNGEDIVFHHEFLLDGRSGARFDAGEPAPHAGQRHGERVENAGARDRRRRSPHDHLRTERQRHDVRTLPSMNPRRAAAWLSFVISGFQSSV